jgi:hypothetical protein
MLLAIEVENTTSDTFSYVQVTGPSTGKPYHPNRVERLARLNRMPSSSVKSRAKGSTGQHSFLQGFIKTAHFAKVPGYVQVTGPSTGKAYGLSVNDGGGEYESNGARPHARVSSAKKFVNLIERDLQDLCICACTDPSKCNTGERTKI